jgi:nitronate monooxygenase
MSLPKILQNNLSIPVIGSPLFLCSGPELVIAQCKAGIVGSFPALNARPQPVLDEWIIRIKEELAQAKLDNPELPIAPFAVNQIGLVYHDVISVRHAKKAAEQGVDGLILVCSGAGGHAGTLSPFALVREVREFFDGTIILSGAISSGSAVASSLALGADLAYMGTRFIATEEANADKEYKDMLIESAAHDIVYSSLFTGVHGNYLGPSIEKAGLDPVNLPEADKTSMNFGSGGNTEAKAWKDIWGSGQGIGSIKDSPTVQVLVDQLKQEYLAATEDFKAKSVY